MLRGWTRHDFHFEVSPAGEGSAEQWVRQQYPRELARYRSRHARGGLIVIIDADKMNVVDRIRRLESACDEQEVDRRGRDEPVLLAVPKRNVETWLAYLRGESVNEEDAYPKYDCPSDCRPQAKRLHEMCQRGQLAEPAPPSLERCCIEFDSFWCLIE